jgi:two-component system cell cycle response regulator DivK
MKKVLVVEDNEDNLYLMRFMLTENGYQVIEARDGIEGVERAIREKPDLILMDIQLPGIDGLTATKKIRDSTAAGDIPIIVITSYAMVGDEEKALAAGCTGYIKKPIDPETFIEELERCL